MKDLNNIVENYKEGNWEFLVNDRFVAGLCDFLTDEQIEKIGFTVKEEYKGKRQVKEWTRENILAKLKEDVELGLKKAFDKQGAACVQMFNAVLKWNKVLEEGLENHNSDNYARYGLPLFKATAIKYGWENPIGDDEGCEDCYEGNNN